MLQNILRTALLVVLFLSAAAADAAQRTFVSAGSGSDSNPCTRALPCRNFGAAISQTDPGGEVVVLDSGGYGVVTINDAVALIAPAGVHAAITAFSGDAIDIAAGSTDVVILRGLYLSGLGGTFGVDFTNGQTLHVENCVVSGFSSIGVFGHADNADVYVIDTVSRQNNNGLLFFANTSIRASLDSVRAEENGGFGVQASSDSLVTVTRSVAAGNNAGFYSNGSGVINLESCTTTMNGWGVLAEQGTARVRNSMITGNTTGVANGGPGSSTISFGNNGLHGNGTNGSFLTTVAQQ